MFFAEIFILKINNHNDSIELLLNNCGISYKVIANEIELSGLLNKEYANSVILITINDYVLLSNSMFYEYCRKYPLIVYIPDDNLINVKDLELSFVYGFIDNHTSQKTFDNIVDFAWVRFQNTNNIIDNKCNLSENENIKSKLEDIEGRYLSLFQNSQVVILLLDSESGAIIDANNAAGNFYGYSIEQLKAMNIADVNILSFEEIKAAMLRAREKNQNHFHFQHRLSNGSIRDVESFASSFVYKERMYLYSIVHDITQKLKAEKALKMNEERLKIILNLNKFANKSDSEILSYALEQSIKITKSQIGFIGIVSEDESVVKILEWSGSVIKECQVEDSFAMFQVNNSGLWAEPLRTRKIGIFNDLDEYESSKYPLGHIELNKFMCIPIIENDKIVILIGIGNKFSDYNEFEAKQINLLVDAAWKIIEKNRFEKALVASEASYRDIFENANDIIFVIDLDANIKSFNKAFEKISGFSANDRLNLNNILSDNSFESVMLNFKNLTSGRTKESFYLADLKIKNGEIITLEINSRIILKNNIPFEVHAIARDVTYRKKVEEKALISQLIIENSPAVLFKRSPIDNLKVDYVSSNISNFGYTAKDLISGQLTFRDLIHPDDLERVLQEIEEKNKLNILSYEQEYRIITRDGAVRWINDSTYVLKDRNNVIINYQGILNDITERKLAEIENLKKNRNLKILSECYMSLIYADNVNELMFSFCDTIVNVGGYPAAIIVKIEEIADAGGIKHFRTLPIASAGADNIKLANFRYQDIPADYECSFIESFVTNKMHFCNKSENCNYCYATQENNIKFLSLSVPLRSRESIKGTLIVFYDKSFVFDDTEMMLLADIAQYATFGIDNIFSLKERRRIEEIQKNEKEELSTTLNSISDGVITINQHGDIKLINNAIVALFEQSYDEIVRKKIFDLFDVVDDPDDVNLFNPFDLLNSAESDVFEVPRMIIRTDSRTKKIITINGNRVQDAKHNFIGIVMIVRDITESVKIEQQVALSQKMESIGQLAAGIAHEINTPLQYVGDNTYFLKDAFNDVLDFIDNAKKDFTDAEGSGNFAMFGEKFADLLKEFDYEFLTKEIPEALERSQSGIQRVGRIVLAMKNFSHPSSKEHSWANINEGIEVTVTISKNEWKYVADLQTNLDSSLPLIYCSIDEINQVILNMIVNASHAIEDIYNKNKQKGLIVIETKQSEDNVLISISDSGIGIKKENIDKIFDPFFTTKKVGKGTGQGLAISHDIIVNKHKGHITVDSEIGLGTTFTIYLPIHHQ